MMNAEFKKHGNNMISIKGLVENENLVRRKLIIVEVQMVKKVSKTSFSSLESNTNYRKLSTIILSNLQNFN